MAAFSHIYVESSIFEDEEAKRLISRFDGSDIVKIEHYKDVFCRSHQSFYKQKEQQSLIIAQKHGELFYPGAKVCQSFGNEHFYYTSCAMNCLYNCEYCYLGGMYPSGNMVVFINQEDYFYELTELLKLHPVYLCVSYDTDLLAIESITGMLGRWIEFADNNNGLTIEIRTKCANIKPVQKQLEKCKHPERIIFAYTLSPSAIIDKYEGYTASLQKRVEAIAQLQRLSIPVRFCFDPMIYIPDWKKHYKELAEYVFEAVDKECIKDASVGTFRISNAYLKNMRKNNPASVIAQFPYVCEEGVYHYPNEIMTAMQEFMTKQCLRYLREEQIFKWTD